MGARRNVPNPLPHHRIKHGTRQGYEWHARQRKKDPEHEVCASCRKYLADRSKKHRDRRRSQRAIVFQILARANNHDSSLTRKDAVEAERLIQKLASAEEKRALYD